MCLCETAQCTLIKVDPVNGTNQLNCWNGTVSCKGLNYALQGVNHNNNITIWLFSGVINLSSSNTTELANISNITIVGSGNTTLQCNTTNAGLYFVMLTDLTIANLTISNCSMLQNSTTWNNSSPVQYPSAITIYNSNNITIHSVSFRFNNGIGLSIINTGGSVKICGCTFDSNYITNANYPGGGGLYIEFPFCLLNNFCDYTSSASDYWINHSHYTVDSCTFTDNVAKKLIITSPFSKETLFIYTEQTFGRGGGMSVFVRGYSTNNTINIVNTKFMNNTAIFGGGLYIAFSHYASGNIISINNSQFSHNHCSDSDNPEGPGGGGVQIFYSFYNKIILPSHNSVTFFQTCFTSNTAYWGGGIGYVLGKEQQVRGTNMLYFIKCSWFKNVAKFGAAVDLYRPLGPGAARAVTFESCLFVHNSASYNLQTDKFELQGAGTVYANSIVAEFKGFMNFTKNMGSAVVLFTSYVYVTDGSNVTFTQNNGWRGGALSLLASSWINVGENTTVVFDGNDANEVGGAIYAELISEHKVVTQWNCFIQFTNPSVPPDNWTTKIEFQRNYAFFGGHAIYATTLHSCVWNKNSVYSDRDIEKAFHWKSFEFDGEPGTHNFSRKGEIATATNHLIANQTAIKVTPGEKYPLPFKACDDEGHDAKAVFFIQSDNKTTGSVDKQSIYIYGDIMQVYGAPSSNFNLTVTSLGSIPYAIKLNVTFDYCPPGYIAYKKDKYDNSTSCKCANENSYGIPGISQCNDTSYRAYITRYNWGGIHKPSGKFVTAVCPEGYCTFAKYKYDTLLPHKRTDLDLFQCQKQHRTGDICGECMNGYSISAQSNCVKCSHGILMGIILFLTYECLPTVIFVSVILIFNVNITSGHWHSLIFYFQIVEILNLYALQSTKEYAKEYEILINIHEYTFGIWNLDYYSPDVCYFSGIHNVFFLYALKYFTVGFAIFSVIVLVVIKNLRCTKFRCNVQGNFNKITDSSEANVTHGLRKYCNDIIRICKQCFSTQSSLIHGLATVLVLSYTKIALLSMKFFIPGQMYTSYHNVIETRVHHVGTMKYFQGEHLAFVIPAMFFLVVSALLPCYLVLKSLCMLIYSKYRYEWCEKLNNVLNCCLSQDKVHQILEEFYGSFKVNCRFYAGFFFVYRLALYATFAFTPSLMIQYCVQQCLLGFFLFVHSIFQPYNENFAFANILDALIFMNLIVINALSIYNFYSVIDIQSPSQAALVIQLLLVYLPLLYIPFRIIWYCHDKQICAPNFQYQPLVNLADAPVDLEEEREQLKDMEKSVDESQYYIVDDIPSQTDCQSATDATNSHYRHPQVDKIQNDS